MTQKLFDKIPEGTPEIRWHVLEGIHPRTASWLNTQYGINYVLAKRFLALDPKVKVSDRLIAAALNTPLEDIPYVPDNLHIDYDLYDKSNRFRGWFILVDMRYQRRVFRLPTLVYRTICPLLFRGDILRHIFDLIDPFWVREQKEAPTKNENIQESFVMEQIFLTCANSRKKIQTLLGDTLFEELQHHYNKV